jgi:hypothetical protein
LNLKLHAQQRGCRLSVKTPPGGQRDQKQGGH